MQIRTLVIAFLIGLSVAIHSVSGAPLANRVPAGADVYLGWQGSPRQWAGYRGSHLQAIWHDDQLPSLIGPYVQRLLLHLSETKPQVAIIGRMIWVPLRALWNSKAAIYLDGAVVSKSGNVLPRFGIVVQGSQSNRRTLQRTFAALAQLLNANSAPNHPMAVVGKAARTVYLLIQPNSQMLALAKSSGPDALAARHVFNSAVGKVGGAGGAVVYVDMRKSIRLLRHLPMLATASSRKQFDRILQYLQVNRARQFALTAKFWGGNMAYSAFLSLTPLAAGNAIPLHHAPIAHLLSNVPADATTVKISRGNPLGLIYDGLSLIQFLSPADQARWHKEIEKINTALGFRLRRDFIGKLGHSSLVFCAPSIGGTSEFAPVTELLPRDPEKISQETSTIIRTFGREISSQMMKRAGSESTPPIHFKVLKLSVDGVVIHYVDSPYMSPAWCVDGHRLIYALYPQMLAALVQRMNTPHRGVMSNPLFAASVKKLGGISHTASLSYEDLNRQVNSTYLHILRLQRTIFGLADIFATPSPGMLIPPLPELKKELNPSISKTWLGKTGWHWLAISPFPGSSIFSPMSPMGTLTAQGVSVDSMVIAILLPSLAKAKELANRAVSGANERGIIQAAYIYAQSHHGQFPPYLSLLVAQNTSEE